MALALRCIVVQIEMHALCEQHTCEDSMFADWQARKGLAPCRDCAGWAIVIARVLKCLCDRGVPHRAERAQTKAGIRRKLIWELCSHPAETLQLQCRTSCLAGALRWRRCWGRGPRPGILTAESRTHSPTPTAAWSIRHALWLVLRSAVVTGFPGSVLRCGCAVPCCSPHEHCEVCAGATVQTALCAPTCGFLLCADWRYVTYLMPL